MIHVSCFLWQFANFVWYLARLKLIASWPLKSYFIINGCIVWLMHCKLCELTSVTAPEKVPCVLYHICLLHHKASGKKLAWFRQVVTPVLQGPSIFQGHITQNWTGPSLETGLSPLIWNIIQTLNSRCYQWDTQECRVSHGKRAKTVFLSWWIARVIYTVAENMFVTEWFMTPFLSMTLVTVQ